MDDRLIDEPVSRAQAEGPQLTGEGGLPQQLTKRLRQPALEGEITDHLGCDKHDPAVKNGGNSRDDSHAKTVLTDVGPVGMSVPRDRGGSFEPKIVKKRQKRLTGVDETVRHRTTVRTRVVHLLRNSSRHAARQGRDKIAELLKPATPRRPRTRPSNTSRNSPTPGGRSIRRW